MNANSLNLQDDFLSHLCTQKVAATVFLVNGVKLQGVITWFDNFSFLLRRESHVQLIYKHAVSTIMPNSPVNMFAADLSVHAAVLDEDNEAHEAA